MRISLLSLYYRFHFYKKFCHRFLFISDYNIKLIEHFEPMETSNLISQILSRKEESLKQKKKREREREVNQTN